MNRLKPKSSTPAITITQLIWGADALLSMSMFKLSFIPDPPSFKFVCFYSLYITENWIQIYITKYIMKSAD